MLSALTPLVKAAHPKRMQWVEGVMAYTAGGLASSLIVGAALGGLGGLAGVSLDSSAALAAALLLAAVAAGRELGVLPYRLPQLHRASNGSWATTFGRRRAAFLWGLDIGAVFTTWLTFAGTWWVVSVAVLNGSPAFGAGLLVSYWLGRAATVWAGPLLLHSARLTPHLPSIWAALLPRFRLLNGAAVAIGAASLALIYAT